MSRRIDHERLNRAKRVQRLTPKAKKSPITATEERISLAMRRAIRDGRFYEVPAGLPKNREKLLWAKAFQAQAPTISSVESGEQHP